MKMKIEKIYRQLWQGKPLSRRMKKAYLGKKINKSKLRKLLSSVVITKNTYPDSSTITPFEFCPKCGCTATTSSHNMAEYPEIYIKTYCARCGFLVAMVDNSPCYHALEFAPDYTIE